MTLWGSFSTLWVRLSPMVDIIRRIALVVGGLFLLVANNSGGGDGTFLGFYPLASSEMVGYNISKLAIAALALWIIYRGVRPRRRLVESASPTANTQR